MKVIDLTAPRRELRVRLDPSPAYDFLACLYLLGNDSEDLPFEVPAAWVARARATLGAELRADLKLLFPWRGRALGIVGIIEHTPGLSVRAFIKRIASTPAEELLELMLAETLADRHALSRLRAAIGGTPAAIDDVIDATEAEVDRKWVRRLLALPPSEVRARLVRLFREGYARVYAAREAEVLPLLEQDVAARARTAGASTTSALIERATGGFVIEPDAGYAGVVLAPTYFFRPYNLITAYRGVRVFIYPIETSHDTDTPPAELVRYYKALADDTRLRVLRLLAGREMYLQELARALGVSHVTVLHHVALLRAAHLVQVVERENLKYYRLRTDQVHDASLRWREFIQR